MARIALMLVVLLSCFAPLMADTDTDPECANYNHTVYGKVGRCICASQCPCKKYYISGLCPTKKANVKCCFKKPKVTHAGSCSATASLACKVQNHTGIMLLANVPDPKGAGDGADAASNIRDACNGQAARRSSYCCAEGCAPGGSVCLDATVLQYLLDVANAGHNIKVNAIAGACHTCTSFHYKGQAVDLQANSGSAYAAWMSICAAAGAVENLGPRPGDTSHSGHTHCAI